MTTKVKLEFHSISQRLREASLPQVDVVVGIARGGIVPASLVAHQLAVPLVVLRLNYRDDDNKPRRAAPELIEPATADLAGMRVLLVDDVSVSGATLNKAREILSGSIITTLAFKGKADIVLFPEVRECVDWPWRTA